jgi:hypothetical protein
MPQIVVQNQIIQFPDSATSPNWAPPVIQFAQAVANALSLLVGSADVFPQNFTIDAFNGVTNQAIPNLLFSTAAVRGAIIRYTVFRSTSTTTVAEAGQILIVYNPANPTNNKWEIQREYTGNANTTFSITDTGQVQFSNTALGGISHTGKIAFAAQALLQN